MITKPGPTAIDPIQRFLQQLMILSEGGIDGRPCWVWSGSLSRGYGNFYPNGRRSKVPAHRWAYQLWIGPIQTGLQIDHLCFNRACVNPSHLEPVTAQVNILRGRGVAAQNARKTHCPTGHAYTADNTFISKGKRYCRECDRIHQRSRRKVA